MRWPTPRSDGPCFPSKPAARSRTARWRRKAFTTRAATPRSSESGGASRPTRTSACLAVHRPASGCSTSTRATAATSSCRPSSICSRPKTGRPGSTPSCRRPGAGVSTTCLRPTTGCARASSARASTSSATAGTSWSSLRAPRPATRSTTGSPSRANCPRCSPRPTGLWRWWWPKRPSRCARTWASRGTRISASSAARSRCSPPTSTSRSGSRSVRPSTTAVVATPAHSICGSSGAASPPPSRRARARRSGPPSRRPLPPARPWPASSGAHRRWGGAGGSPSWSPHLRSKNRKFPQVSRRPMMATVRPLPTIARTRSAGWPASCPTSSTRRRTP